MSGHYKLNSQCEIDPASVSWWRQAMGTLSATLILCEENLHRTPMHSSQKVRGPFVFPLFLAWKMCWTNSRIVDDFRPCDITVTSWWARWRVKSPDVGLFTQPFIQTQIKENIKAPRHWPLWREFTDEFPTQRTSNAENVSMWWRHHGCFCDVNVMFLAQPLLYFSRPQFVSYSDLPWRLISLPPRLLFDSLFR